MGNLLLSIDIGTTAIKAGCFTVEGNIKSSAYLEYPLMRSKPLCVEQDASLWWKLSKQVINKVLMDTYCIRNDIVAMSISAQGISFAPVDKDGYPLHNAFSWLDTRAIEQTQRIKKLFNSEDESFKRLGLHTIPTYTLPKIMWLKDHKRDIFDKTFKFCTCLDFINKRLVDEFITDYSIAGGTLAYDMQKMDWAHDILKEVDVPSIKMPLINWAGTLLGNIQHSAAVELGLPDSLQVVLGGHDQECAALGAGLRKSELSISLGTASILIAPVNAPTIDSKLRIPCYPHVEKGQFVLEAVVSAAGISFRWLRDLFNSILGKKNRSCFDYEDLIALAKESPPGSNGLIFLPHLSGATSPFWNPHTSGVFFGISLATNPSDIARALLEGWCYQLKSNLLVIEEITGYRENILIFGGGARSNFLKKLLSDIIDRPLIVSSTSETALLGGAMLAGYGSGIYSNLEDAKDLVRKEITMCENDLNTSSIYQELYESYRETENKIIHIM